MGGQHPMSFQCPRQRRVNQVQQRCADCKSLIHVSPLSVTKDPRPQTKVMRNLESAVRPHRNATVTVTVQTFMLKC